MGLKVGFTNDATMISSEMLSSLHPNVNDIYRFVSRFNDLATANRTLIRFQ